MKRYIVIFLVFSSCIHDKISEEKITIINNSKRRLLFSHSRLFPDTSLKETYSTGCDPIKANSICDAQTRLGWSLEFERNSQSVVTFFISDNDTVLKYGGDKWRSDYLILKRYQFTKDSLVNRNWTITYP